MEFHVGLSQDYSTLVLDGHCPRKFSSNPKPAHLNILIKDYLNKIGMLDKSWS